MADPFDIGGGPTQAPGSAETAPDAPAPLSLAQPTVNPVAELVADLLEPTRLVATDRLAGVRSRAGQGSFAQALRDEGLALDGGVARALAERYHLPFVDVGAQSIAPEAVGQIPLS